MWKKLKALSDSKPIKSVLEIVKADNSISNDVTEVLERWFSDISKLYSGIRDDPDIIFNEELYNQVLNLKVEFERLDPTVQEEQAPYSTDTLNSDISLEEVSNAIDKAKLRKAYLDIPNEAMKNPQANILLHKFFSICFLMGICPTEWYNSHIKPIPKKDKDPQDPLNNRCITIMCCVAKIYSTILNTRLQTFLETNNILADEQNGFRASRSCIDHIFSLCTILFSC